MVQGAALGEDPWLDVLDWAALSTISVACTHVDFVAERSRRYDDPAIAVVEENVGAVGFGETWRALEEFLGVHERFVCVWEFPR